MHKMSWCCVSILFLVEKLLVHYLLKDKIHDLDVIVVEMHNGLSCEDSVMRRILSSIRMHQGFYLKVGGGLASFFPGF